ncbi:MAG TPA: chemotaxis protein CheX [Bacillota bacterium]|nr:chemotaxis protein CheX [Bacillota bacterium]HOL11120.1 chemotaxis protein CheX [Bacillota bacterium]HPO97600.1 chemotaxis protein CheX [Bacillota bacterium]
MQPEKFRFLAQSVKEAYQIIAAELAGERFDLEPEPETLPEDQVISVIVGAVGNNSKGRIMVEMAMETARRLTEEMNGEPFTDEFEMYLFLAEFANIFSGKAITKINNTYKGVDLRLTPPAIFTGDKMEITTPSIQSEIVFFKSESGVAKLDIGFEGE